MLIMVFDIHTWRDSFHSAAIIARQTNQMINWLDEKRDASIRALHTVVLFRTMPSLFFREIIRASKKYK